MVRDSAVEAKSVIKQRYEKRYMDGMSTAFQAGLEGVTSNFWDVDMIYLCGSCRGGDLRLGWVRMR